MNPDTGEIRTWEEAEPTWMALTEEQKTTLERFSQEERRLALAELRQYGHEEPDFSLLEKQLTLMRTEAREKVPDRYKRRAKNYRGKAKAHRRQSNASRRRNRRN